MIETPQEYRAARGGTSARAEDLRRFSYHTGGSIQPIVADEPCPVLLRDIGPVAMARFLRGDLQRLSGPYAPILYLRTGDYREPYTDYGRIGRLIFLRPLALGPWHSGIAHIYVAPVPQTHDARSIGFWPADLPLEHAHALASDVKSAEELREALGGKRYDDVVTDSLSRIEQLNREDAKAEELARPMRRLFQSGQQSERDKARDLLNRCRLSETDLCTAWHHLPPDRRESLHASLSAIAKEFA